LQELQDGKCAGFMRCLQELRASKKAGILRYLQVHVDAKFAGILSYDIRATFYALNPVTDTHHIFYEGSRAAKNFRRLSVENFCAVHLDP